MRSLKQNFFRFQRWQHAWVAIIIIASALLHLGLMWFPNDLVLDEQYYIEASRDYLQQGALHQPEHPPLAKLFITAGMQIFGDNQFGWRIMPIIFGLLGIFFFYRICRHFQFSNTVTNVTTALFAFENSAFLMASVAMLDIFSITLMLGGFWAYLSRKYPLSIAFLTLAALCKLTAIFGVSAIGLHWLLFRRDQVLTLALSALIAYASGILLISGLEWVLIGEWQNPLTRAGTLISIPTTITFANSSHPSAVHPWQWVLGYQVMPFWWNPQYISAVNPTTWALTLPIFGYTTWLGLRKKHEAAFFAAAWIFATLIVWIVIGFITDRITYIFYFAPIVGGVVLGLAVLMEKAIEWGRERGRLKKVYWGIGVFLALHLLFFLALSPFTGLWPVTVK